MEGLSSFDHLSEIRTGDNNGPQQIKQTCFLSMKSIIAFNNFIPPLNKLLSLRQSLTMKSINKSL